MDQQGLIALLDAKAEAETKMDEVNSLRRYLARHFVPAYRIRKTVASGGTIRDFESVFLTSFDTHLARLCELLPNLSNEEALVGIVADEARKLK